MGLFCMPSLGADMEHGRLVEWKVERGERARPGDIVATVETEKGAIDIETFEDVVFEMLLVEEGEEVPVGADLAVTRKADVGAGDQTEPIILAVSTPKEQLAEPEEQLAEPEQQLAEPEQPAPRSSALPPAEALRERGPRPSRASPLARRLARELEVDLASLQGTGPHGAIKRQDVLRAAEGQPPAEAPAEPAPETDPAPAPPDKSAMRRAIATTMSRSKREIPHYYLVHDIPIDPALVWLEGQNLERQPRDRLLLAALQIRAVALAAVKFPGLNGFWNKAFEPSAGVHLGFAISLRGGGLVAPAIRDAETKDVETVMQDLRDLVHRARRGGLKASEMTSPSITVSCLGEQGVDQLTGIIQPPQVALVGFGTPAERPWAVDGFVVARRIVTATLSADHRASDGHTGGRFLREISDLLQTPDRL